MRVTQSIRVSEGKIEKVWKDYRFDYGTWPICYAFCTNKQIMTLNIKEMQIQRRSDCKEVERVWAHTAVFCKRISAYMTGTEAGQLIYFSH